MGMYTELHYNVELLYSTPNTVITVLNYMLGEEDRQPVLPDHPLFATERWKVMLTMDSAYFAADTHSTLRAGYAYWILCVRCNLKNYHEEIEKFIDWLDQYVDAASGDFLGFYRCEETEIPALIRKQ
jgi:hypothetical protein